MARETDNSAPTDTEDNWGDYGRQLDLEAIQKAFQEASIPTEGLMTSEDWKEWMSEGAEDEQS